MAAHLIFVLIVEPAGAALHIARRPAMALLVSVTLALVAMWVGMALPTTRAGR